MIYAYCLSIFSIHFFTKHNISKFKVRLINQQTGDCTDSIILNAAKLSTETLPVSIKLKGGERLLMKVKLLSLVANQSEVVIGEGVVNFDHSSIDNTLRVPIYDKQKGIEEVAVCSIDFFLSGFEIDKQTTINHQRSRSKFEDWRQKTEDAVYSQMSYTVESHEGELKEEQEHHQATLHKNLNDLQIQKIRPEKLKKGRQGGGQNDEKIQKKDDSDEPLKSKQKKHKQNNKGPISKLVSSKLQAHINPDSEIQDSMLILENNIYLDPLKVRAKKENAIPLSSPQKKKYVFDTMSEDISNNHSQQSLISTHTKKEQNEDLLVRLKKYMGSLERQAKQISPKHKKRRKKIKVEQFAVYSLQNNFIKYYIDKSAKSNTVIKNIRVTKTIQSHIKESNDSKVVPLFINKLSIFTQKGQKIAIFDMLGFRSHCLLHNQKQSTAAIQIPQQVKAMKVLVSIEDEGLFEGTIGVQEGEQMNIKLTKMNNNHIESVLQHSEYKLIFDIKADFVEKKSVKIINPIPVDQISFREPFESTTPQNDIKRRVEMLGSQPWGFAASYASQKNLSPESKKILAKINNQLPQIGQESSKSLSHNKNLKDINKPESKSMKKEKNKKSSRFLSEEQKNRSMPNKTRQYLENSPVKKVKLKPIHSPSSSQQFDDITGIRNGNRNNYKFKDINNSKHIKQAWQQILFKRRLEEERLDKKKIQQSRKFKEDIRIRRGRQVLNALNRSGTEGEDSSSVASNISFRNLNSKKINTIYEYKDKDEQKSLFPLRQFTLKISNVSITLPEVVVKEHDPSTGNFVKFTIVDKVTYFTEVIFSGEYNSILWKLQGCLFQQLQGQQRLEIEIYQTIKDRVRLLGKSEIRVNRLYFLRNNHIYNGKALDSGTCIGEFTIGFQISELYPFEVIQEEEEYNSNMGSKKKLEGEKTAKKSKLYGHQSQSQKYMKKNAKYKGLQSTLGRGQERDKQEENEQMEESMSMPIGLGKQNDF